MPKVIEICRIYNTYTGELLEEKIIGVVEVPVDPFKKLADVLLKTWEKENVSSEAQKERS